MSMTFEEAVDLHQAVVGVVAELGVFDRVNDHEAKNRPGRGLAADVIYSGMSTSIKSSGLNSTTINVSWLIRVMSPAAGRPEGDTEAAMMHASVAIAAALAGGYTLGGRVKAVDLRGVEGQRLQAPSGYLTIDQTKYRITGLQMTATLNDRLEEAA